MFNITHVNKKSLKLSFIAFITATVLNIAHAASSNIAYQGVAFNNGVIVASMPIALKFTILGSDGTTIVYQKTPQAQVTTTDKGFFSHPIGSGTRTAGAASYGVIVWADGYKLKVEVDYANGTTYTDLGIEEFTSSVYAHKATNATNAGKVYSSGEGVVNAIRYLTFIENVNDAYYTPHMDSGLQYNPATQVLTTTNFTGALTGNAATATKLAATKTIDITGDITATAVAFDGSSNIAISAAVNNDSHTHTGSTISSLAGTDITTGTISDARLPATISSNITGNAATATTTTTATTANQASRLFIYNDDTGDTNNPILFTATTNSGYKDIFEDSALYFDNTSNRLYSTSFSGSLIGNASSATALAANPADCAAGLFATAINASGTLTCTAQRTITDSISSSSSTISASATAVKKAYDKGNHTHPYLSTGGGTVSGSLTINGQFSKSVAGYYYYSRDLEEQSNIPFSTGASTASENTTAIYTSLYAAYAIVADAFVAPSDKRIKKDITPLENSLDAINKLNPVTYIKKDTFAHNGRLETGFIAQEVKEILPSAVSIGKGDIPVLKTVNEMSFEDGVKYTIQITKDGENEKQDYIGGEELPEGEIYVISKEVDDFHSIEYGVLYTHAIKAIQEQQEQIKAMQVELTALKTRLDSKVQNQ